MIEKMKRICLVSSASRKQALLSSLRDFGLLHLAEKKSADRAATERFANLAKTEMALKDYAEKKKPNEPLLSDEAFESLYRDVLKTLRTQVELLDKELRATSQRVNLFEKVKIPEARENIRVIGVYLGDQQTAAVVRGKISKKKLKEAGQ